MKAATHFVCRPLIRASRKRDFRAMCREATRKGKEGASPTQLLTRIGTETAGLLPCISAFHICFHQGERTERREEEAAERSSATMPEPPKPAAGARYRWR